MFCKSKKNNEEFINNLKKFLKEPVIQHGLFFSNFHLHSTKKKKIKTGSALIVSFSHVKTFSSESNEHLLINGSATYHSLASDYIGHVLLETN